MLFPLFQRRKPHTLIAAAVAVGTLMVSRGAAADEQVTKCINDIKSGPAVYYTPEAAAYFASQGNYSVFGSSTDKEAALRSFRACVKLSSMTQDRARDALPALIDYFPRAVHVVFLRNATYSYGYGETGTYDDCVSTYVMNAKNQSLLSSPFLEYSTLIPCENFVESSYETEVLSRRFNAAGAVVEAAFNLKIVLTFYAGECALSHLTGMSLGHDPMAWRQSGLGYSSPAPAYGAPAPSSPSSYNFTVTGPNTVVITKTSGTALAPVYATNPDIVVKGKYKISLKTGDELTGTVESRNDTSLVFETTEGKPYVFKFSLIQSYQVIAVPASTSGSSGSSSSGLTMEPVSYDDLKNRAATHPAIEVKIASGSSFRGNLVSISDDELKIDVGGSSIPFAKDVVKQLFILPAGALQNNEPPAQNPGKPHGLLDSVWIKTGQADQLYAGTIIEEKDDFIALNPGDGTAALKFPRNQIRRVVRQSAAASPDADAIARYAKPLSCPKEMVAVDLPPGRSDKPFFKVCIDKYEYPNLRGGVPRTSVPFDEARSLCAQQGKRLCTADEWTWACSGLDGLAYPYGNSFVQDRCNNDTRLIETSGSHRNCVSPFGGYDMAGNVFEWVVNQNGKLALMGGPYSKCQTISFAPNGDAKPQFGLRCCKSN
jgi:hypothetical protein